MQDNEASFRDVEESENGPQTVRGGAVLTERVRAFPWGSLEKWSKREAAALRNVHRAVRASSQREAFERELSSILGEPTTVRLGRPRPIASFSGERTGFALSFRRDDGVLGLFVEAALADYFLRAAYHRPKRATPLGRLETDAPRVASALLAAAGTLLRRSKLPNTVPAHAVTTLGTASPEAWMMHAFGDAIEVKSAIVVPVIVETADEAFVAALFVPESALFVRNDDASEAFALSKLGHLPLRLSVVREHLALTAEEFAALRFGDVLLLGPPKTEMGEGRASRAGTIPVELAAPSGERRLSADLVDGGKIVLRFSRAVMSEPDLAHTLEEAPVVVRVEVGSVELPALEWAGLADGDVVALEQPVGAAIVLRVGGHIVAEGELVDVEGTLGVRILRRL